MLPQAYIPGTEDMVSSLSLVKDSHRDNCSFVEFESRVEDSEYIDAKSQLFKPKFNEKYDLLGLTFREHIWFRSLQKIIQSHEGNFERNLRKQNLIINHMTWNETPQDETSEFEKTTNNLFFSDYCKVYIDKFLRKGIMVIFRGIVYFILNEGNLNRKITSANAGKHLLLEPFDFLEDVKLVFLPRTPLNEH